MIGIMAQTPQALRGRWFRGTLLAMDIESKPPEAPEAPDWAKSALWLWHHSQQHREALLKPPVLLAFAIIAAIFYYFGSSRNGEQLDIKNERIGFLNDQVNAYKDRLQGATPDQAAKQIVTLQDRLQASEKKLQESFPITQDIYPIHKKLSLLQRMMN